MSARRDDVQTPIGGVPLVRLVDVDKSYPGVRALESISLDFYEGEIHSIVGENGAGKSTLVRMLAGLEQPDAGVILVDGRAVRLKNPRAARRDGVSFVPQEAEGISTFSVGRSLMLGREGRWINRSRLSPAESRLVADALERMGMTGLDGNAPVSGLSIAELRLCQIAGTLVDPGRLIVLDEPTAVLADADSEVLLDRLERLREDGRSILYISHRLGEVLRISDRITVLRDGKVVGSFARGEIDRVGMLSLMARKQGESVSSTASQGAAPVETASRTPRLSVRGLTRAGAFRGIDLDVAPGQVVGIAGIQGSGHGKLLEALAGSSIVDSGNVEVDGSPVEAGSLRQALGAGIRLVPEERRTRGIVGALSLRENMSIGFGTAAQRRFLRKPKEEKGTAAKAVTELGIHARDIDVLVQTLSGGNQQKVVIARVLESNPGILLLCEPTQGIDVRSKAEILGLLREAARSKGLGIVLASSEFEELLEYTDVIHVMCAGEIVKTVPTRDTNYSELLEAAVP
jgi:ABC-type sugar transport system ATPase subunit